MNDNTKESIDFSLGEEDELQDLLNEISSSHSAKLSCSFEYSDEIQSELLTNDDLIKSRSKRKGIPEEVKSMASNFIDTLFLCYKNEDKRNNEIMQKTNSIKSQKSFTKKGTKDYSVENSNADTKYTTFYKKGTTNSEKIDNNITKESSPNHMGVTKKRFQEAFEIEEMRILPTNVGCVDFIKKNENKFSKLNYQSKKISAPKLYNIKNKVIFAKEKSVPHANKNSSRHNLNNDSKDDFKLPIISGCEGESSKIQRKKTINIKYKHKFPDESLLANQNLISKGNYLKFSPIRQIPVINRIKDEKLSLNEKSLNTNSELVRYNSFKLPLSDSQNKITR